jgi:sulfur relay protein TusB/DsrH
MSILHLAYSKQGVDRACARMRSGDELILLGDGVYSAPNAPHWVLEDDVTARGLSSTNAITYDAMVELSISHDKVVSWP